MSVFYKLFILLVFASLFSCRDGGNFDAGSPEKAVQIAGGLVHMCALLDQEHVFCWGENNENQLSLNKATNAGGEIYDLKNEKVSQISAGTYHTCGLFKGGDKDGLPFCFGKSGPWLKVPNKKMHAVYAAYDLTCFLDVEDHLDCVGKPMPRLGPGSTIDPALLVKNYGIDPISGKGGQDFSAKQFKNIKFDENWAALCAQEISSEKIYCMGQENYPGVQAINKVNARDFYIGGQSKGYIDAASQKLDFVGASFGFQPADNLAKPRDLKYKAIIAPTASYGNRGFIVAKGNLYDDLTPIPEGAIIIPGAPKTLVFEDASSIVLGLGSTKAAGNYYYCLLKNNGKVGCKYFEQGAEVPTNALVKNLPKSLRV
jgi:hypothetical protein